MEWAILSGPVAVDKERFVAGVGEKGENSVGEKEEQKDE